MGCNGGYLDRCHETPNEAVLELEAESLEKAKQFVQSEDLRDTMKRAGVVDRPDIYFLDDADRPKA